MTTTIPCTFVHEFAIITLVGCNTNVCANDNHYNFGALVHELVMITQHANTTYVPRACASIFGNWYVKLYHHYSMNR
jgi:hypothetical protein